MTLEALAASGTVGRSCNTMLVVAVVLAVASGSSVSRSFNCLDQSQDISYTCALWIELGSGEPQKSKISRPIFPPIIPDLSDQIATYLFHGLAWLHVFVFFVVFRKLQCLRTSF